MADNPTTDQTPDSFDDQQGETLDTDRVITEIPDRPVSFERGTTVAEQKAGPSLERRTNIERPDITADDDPSATPLVDDADGVAEGGLDGEKDLVAGGRVEQDEDDSGHPTAPPSAEEAAIRDRGAEVPGGVDRRA